MMRLKTLMLTLIVLVSILVACLSGCDEARQIVSPAASTPEVT